MNNENQFSFLDLITIISFMIGLYALELGYKNLQENRLQSQDSQEILFQLENHLKAQDEHLHAQDLHLKEQDKLLLGKEEKE